MENSYHFIGIGGIGMSALAQILLQKGIKVSGSDLSSSYVTEALKKAGANLFLGHKTENIQEPEVIVYSTAILNENPEFQEGIRKKIPFMHRSDLLRDLMNGYSSLLVTGTHGKTTTSSLLAHVLVNCGLAPSFAIGGIVRSLGSNGGYGKGRYFVAEACESDGTFLKFPAFGAIITNIDTDHLDFWKSLDALEKGFVEFADKVESQDHLFYCQDDDRLASLMKRGIGYGFSEKAMLQIHRYQQIDWKLVFDLSFNGKTYSEIEIPLIGRHNVLNASAVFGLSLQIGISEDAIRKAFSSFTGVGRRVEKKAELDSISIYDDYAHHPTEITATLDAIKKALGERRLVVAFQPHRYSRTKDCMDQFPDAFKAADAIVMTDIYAAGEKPQEGVTTEVLLRKMQEKNQGSVFYASRGSLASFLTGFLEPNDVLLTVGAGDITKIADELKKQLFS